MIVSVKKFDGSVEPFNEDKLIDSLVKAGAENDIARVIAESIQSSLPEISSTSLIYKEAFKRLKKIKTYRPIIRYSLKQSIRALGPTGFPFEQFIAEIMRKEGYEVDTNKSIRGKCALHEIDVLIVRDGVLTCIEAKFHNDYSYQTDLKTVLYVKARIEDIKDSEIVIGNKGYKTQKGMVVTNTKFSDAAIGYAECAGLEILGWNYPSGKTLHELIEKHKLYPLTVLNSLSLVQKRDLISKGIVTCLQLFKQSGLDNKVLKELEIICQGK